MNNVEKQNQVNLNLEINSKNPPSVRDFRRNSYKVRVVHFRRAITNPWHKLVKPGTDYSPNIELVPEVELELYPQYEVLRNGGLTRVDVTTPDGKKTYTASAKCHEVDNFNRKRGVKIALGRVCKQIQEDVSIPF